MTNTNKPDPSQPSATDSEVNTENLKVVREYEQSGCYPPDGKPFRMWALFGWLTLLTVVLAGVAALLNFLLLDTP